MVRGRYLNLCVGAVAALCLNACGGGGGGASGGGTTTSGSSSPTPASGSGTSPTTSSPTSPTQSNPTGTESVAVTSSCTPPPIPPSGAVKLYSTTYPGGDGNPLGIDIAVPTTGKAPYPLVVLIHSGAWTNGSRTEYSNQIQQLAGQGYVAATLDYRLVANGQNIFPAAVQDLRCGVRWLRSQASNYSIDPNHVAAMGGSSGGTLAAMLGVTGGANSTFFDGSCPLVGNAYPASVNAVASFYGRQDLRADPNNPTHWIAYAPESQSTTDTTVGTYLGLSSANQNPTRNAQASPITQVSASMPPFLMLHGTKDTTVSNTQSHKMKDAIWQQGGAATVVDVQGAQHLFPLLGSTDPATGASVLSATCTTMQFLKNRL